MEQKRRNKDRREGMALAKAKRLNVHGLSRSAQSLGTTGRAPDWDPQAPGGSKEKWADRGLTKSLCKTKFKHKLILVQNVLKSTHMTGLQKAHGKYQLGKNYVPASIFLHQNQLIFNSIFHGPFEVPSYIFFCGGEPHSFS